MLKEHKASSPQHATWVKALRAPFDLLKVCVKKYHVAGPAWNAQGAPLSQFKPGAQPSASTAPSKASAPTALAPPPPAPGAACRLQMWAVSAVVLIGIRNHPILA